MRGWLLDVYADVEEGVVVWLLGENGVRRKLRHRFPIRLYAAAPFPQLRAMWRYLRRRPEPLRLSRVEREDLFNGHFDLLAIDIENAVHTRRLFFELRRSFSGVTWYDADIPLSVRYCAAHGVYPLGKCEAEVDAQGWIQQIAPLQSRWEIVQQAPPLRVLKIEPDVNPQHDRPRALQVTFGKHTATISLRPARWLLLRLAAQIKRSDPDLILTRYGDTWLIPYLLEQTAVAQLPPLPLNRDPLREVERRQPRSYFTYGQIVHRGEQCHLFGRWHIDCHNAMMFNDYHLDGIFEGARVSGLPVQEVARKSPGSGITALQMWTALDRGVLVPYTKQQAEFFKSSGDLMRADRGGMVYQPTVGVHENVIEIDFVSMYPAIMARYNISPETVAVRGAETAVVPELGLPIDQGREGLVPHTLRPLLHKRITIKQLMLRMNPRDVRYRQLKARASALKWLLVVSFGYTGYKNAKFGRIESHEAVTAYSRECLLQVKELAEEMGYELLHFYVDGLWLKHPQVRTPEEVAPLLRAVEAQTGLPIALEGIYRTIVFLPSRVNPRVPVPNRYFGIFRDGSLKVRGIEARRRDTPEFIKQVQVEVLERLARLPAERPLVHALPELLAYAATCASLLRQGLVSPNALLVAQKISRELQAYATPSPAARAAAQLEVLGKSRAAGERIPFWFTTTNGGVLPQGTGKSPSGQTLDIERYLTLLQRALETVLMPLGVERDLLRSVVRGEAYQLKLPFLF